MRRLVDQLDRGWDLLEKGRPEAARDAARRAQRVDPSCPEGHVLLGASLLDLGRPEEALQSFEAALAVDPADVDALLYAAETLMTLEDAEAALPLCQRAASAAGDGERRLDAEILQIQWFLALDDRESAARCARDLPDPPYADVGLEVRAAEAAFEAGEIDRAERLAKTAIAGDDQLGDAHYVLGLIAEERGDVGAMTRAFLKVRELDVRLPAPAWGMTAADFERVAEEALAELPEGIRRRLENVPIIVSDYPSAEVVAEGCDPRMMGFFSGVPYPEKSHVAGQAPHLDCIFLYRRNVECYSRSREELLEEIKKTLLHETGHFFALDDDDLEAIGLG